VPILLLPRVFSADYTLSSLTNSVRTSSLAQAHSRMANTCFHISLPPVPFVALTAPLLSCSNNHLDLTILSLVLSTIGTSYSLRTLSSFAATPLVIVTRSIFVLRSCPIQSRHSVPRRRPFNQIARSTYRQKLIPRFTPLPRPSPGSISFSPPCTAYCPSVIQTTAKYSKPSTRSARANHFVLLERATCYVFAV